jgi:hypothetical protein
VLGELVTVTYEAMRDGSGSRLKACRKPRPKDAAAILAAASTDQTPHAGIMTSTAIPNAIESSWTTIPAEIQGLLLEHRDAYAPRR